MRQRTLIASNLTGFVLIVSACAIALLVPCPTNAQYFILYALIGIGIALLLTRSANRSKANFKIWNISVILTGGVALPFILFFTNPIGAFKPDDCDTPVDVTIFVHGKKSRQDVVLRQEGHVIMDVKGERKRSAISENGEANFKNLHVGDSVRLEIDFSEPYKATYPDSVYVITREGMIYMPIALQGVDKVAGKVLYNDAPLEGVIVEVGTVIDTTNETGSFDILIPEYLQSKEYKVWFIKQGFRTKSAPAFPQTGQSLEIVMEKL
ncbi:hypothetical protein ACFS7Z_07065 [Pontibacter toksunensis]|uniref:Carboxypeptidase regulatory-like domain-containing protein n=1 Tax=Pontibacter toksunensis TaxID=1332631 RepID=A0ABW6BTG6_9BACT